jgi:PAS domain S-box-containing protein
MAEVIHHLPMGVMVYRVDEPGDPGSTTVLHINEIGAEFLRVPVSEILGRPVREFAPDSVETELLRALVTVVETGEPVNLGEIYHESPRVEPGYFRISAFPIAEGVGAAIFEGVNEQREMREALERQALRFRAIFDATFQFVGLLRPDGTVVEANRTALHFGGIEAAEVIGKPYWECYWWSHSPSVQRQLKAAVRRAASGEFIRYNVQIRGKDDTRAVIDFSLKPVYNRGQVVLLIPEGRVITDLVKAQRGLKRLQKRMERILNAAGEGIISVDPGGMVTFANEAAASLLGPATEDLIGRPHTEVLRHVDKGGEDEETSPVDRVLRLERTRRVGNVHLRRDDGTSFPVEYVVSPLREGGKTGAVVVFRDISERLEAERVLRESEARHRIVLTTLDAGVVMVGRDGQILMSNPVVRKMLGFEEDHSFNLFDPNRVILKEDGSYYATEELPEYRVLETGEPQHQAVKGVRLPTGEIRWFSVNARPVPGDDDRPVAAVVSFTDITEQREAEQELRDSEEQLRMAQQIAHLGGWYWDVVADEITWSEELFRIYGVGPDTFQPTLSGLLEKVHTQDRERLQHAVEQAMQTQEPYEVIHRVVRPSGEIRVLLARGEIITDGAGQVVAMQGTAQDITDQQQARDALQRYANELEERNTELEQFAYVASHDLQEPLRMISSFLQLLERRYGEHLDETAKEYIRFAVDGAKRMQRLIQDLLVYSRVGTRGKAFQRVDLGVIVEEVLADLGTAIDESGANVKVGELPNLQADPTQMRQLFQNIIGNALKFRSERPPEIQVSAERIRENGSPVWRVAVQDNGIGIAPEHAERIFQIFQRLHTREEYEGTGIGLAICRKIIERHGGRIWLDSHPDRGSTFYFTIPVRPHRHAQDAGPSDV